MKTLGVVFVLLSSLLWACWCPVTQGQELEEGGASAAPTKPHLDPREDGWFPILGFVQGNQPVLEYHTLHLASGCYVVVTTHSGVVLAQQAPAIVPCVNQDTK